MVIGNTTRAHSRKVYPFDELYGISYNLELTKEELNNMPLNFVRNKYIWTNAEKNLSAQFIVEKIKVRVYLWVVCMGTNLEIQHTLIPKIKQVFCL